MSYINKLQTVLMLIEDLLGDPHFIDQLTGEDQGFLDTIWDYFDRIEAEVNPEEIETTVESDVSWQLQQDNETD